MCIIAIQTKNNFIGEKTLRNCWENNGDGAGIMYAKDGKIVVKKELTSFKKFMEYKREADIVGGNIVMHFRISTSAGVNLTNVHPFKVNSDMHFCHNGVLDIKVPKSSTINDTQIFNNSILRNLPKGFERNFSIMQLIEKSIGDRNKFVFLDKVGKFYIINESAGTWDDGCWYSNTTYLYSYSNNYASNYYVKGKYKKDIINTWDGIDSNYNSVKQCQCCFESKDAIELTWDKYWHQYLCNECSKIYAD